MGMDWSPKLVVMHAQRPYILPIKGLKTGTHTFELTADDDFFASFEDSPIKHANLHLTVNLDKRHRDMVIEFVFSGTIRTECDRCLAEIDFPVSGTDQLTVQNTVDTDLDPEDPALVLISPDAFELNLAPFAYEFFVLSLPMIRTYECQTGSLPYPCDQDLLDDIEKQKRAQSEVVDDDEDDKPNPWGALKDWNKN